MRRQLRRNADISQRNIPQLIDIPIGVAALTYRALHLRKSCSNKSSARSISSRVMVNEGARVKTFL